MSYQRDYQRRLRVGVIGTGSHCYRNILPALHFLPVELVALCDVNVELAQRTASEYGVSRVYAGHKEMFAACGLDAVLIVVSPRMHPVLACDAFDAGLHVWMEKPPAMRTSEVREMIRRRGDLIGTVGFKKAFMPATVKARELLADGGALGSLLSVLGVYPMSIPANGRAVLDKGESTNWQANGCHPLAFMVAVGGEVQGVTVHRGKAGGGVCVLHFTSGAIGTLHLAQGGNNSQPMEHYAVFGTGGHLTVDDVERVAFHRGIPFEYGRTTSFVPPGLDSGTLLWEPQNMLGTLENKSTFTQGTFAELRYFCAAALGEVAAETTLHHPGCLEFALHLTAIYEAALLSEGHRIDVER